MSQLSDLHQKLSKAQNSVGSTRAVAPILKDKDGAGKVCIFPICYAFNLYNDFVQ